ncbi:type II toxin-antitoxin system PemK/MazF family toxin [Knoellia sp. Soil729]|uniref:type II toxin-antitoxin system PemK/MazF family toxin n=1 Tax=Knoellia sp. Soil729 TaxID=1736394 RepID=UPI0006F36386|nr:type II toxin-antitoxin system PemK/MazF family toxin [Knoellia sp. Soil729]KRE43398.1 growth inhibitor PemK [Knoellia sp. Soil729]
MATYPGDFDGPLEPSYRPQPDGEPDAAEVVWAWVPYEEDASQGKDRPVLVLGWDGPWALGLYLTSKDHDRDHEQERRAGRVWVDVGSGGWDSKGRPSEARRNRVVRIDPATIRREGAVLDRARWDEVIAAYSQRDALLRGD